MSEQVVARRGMALGDYLARSAERPFEHRWQGLPDASEPLQHSVLIRALFRALDGLTAPDLLPDFHLPLAQLFAL